MRTFVVALCCGLILIAAAKAPKPPKMPKGPGRELVQAKCATCHALPIIVAQRKTREQWETSMDNMINRGMQVSDADFDLMAAYLSKNYAPDKK